MEIINSPGRSSLLYIYNLYKRLWRTVSAFLTLMPPWMPLPFAVCCLPFGGVVDIFTLFRSDFACTYFHFLVYFYCCAFFHFPFRSFVSPFGSHDFCYILYLYSLIHLFGLMVLSQSAPFPFRFILFHCAPHPHGQPFCSFDVRSLKRCGCCETAARCSFIGWLVIKSNTKTFYFFHLMVFILFVLLCFHRFSLCLSVRRARSEYVFRFDILYGFSLGVNTVWRNVFLRFNPIQSNPIVCIACVSRLNSHSVCVSYASALFACCY